MTNWTNPIHQRLMMWLFRWTSPSIGRIPTLREALTGHVECIWTKEQQRELAEAWGRIAAEARTEDRND
jgi:hypothetical protein